MLNTNTLLDVAMHDTPIRLDHVGIAVESVADAEPVLTALGAEKLVDEKGHGGDYRWVSYGIGDASRLELVEPRTDESFIRAFLDDHGPGLHHVTFEVADVDAVVEALEAAELRVVDRTTYDDYSEAFVSPRNPTGTLFQLMEYHAEYGEGRGGPEDLYVGGTPLESDDD